MYAIFAYIGRVSGVNVGKYASPMERLGYVFHSASAPASSKELKADFVLACQESRRSVFDACVLVASNPNGWTRLRPQMDRRTWISTT